MEKNLEYFLSLPYTRELIPEPSGIWFVRIKELLNCMSQGNSPEEALHNIDDAMYGWIKGELEDGEVIPEPKEEEEYSGNFRLRVPKSLHRKLVEVAEEEGVSLNTICNNFLSEAVGAQTSRKIASIPTDKRDEWQKALQLVCEFADVNVDELTLANLIRSKAQSALQLTQPGELHQVILLLRPIGKASPVVSVLADLLEKIMQLIEMSRKDKTADLAGKQKNGETEVAEYIKETIIKTRRFQSVTSPHLDEASQEYGLNVTPEYDKYINRSAKR